MAWKAMIGNTFILLENEGMLNRAWARRNSDWPRIWIGKKLALEDKGRKEGWERSGHFKC